MDKVEQNIVICQRRADQYYWSARHWKSRYFAITEFNNNIVLSFNDQVCLHILITFWQLWEVFCHFSLENVVLIAHEQNIICSKTRLDGTTHEQTIICGQLFAGHLVGSWPMERTTKMHWMIILDNSCNIALLTRVVTVHNVYQHSVKYF